MYDFQLSFSLFCIRIKIARQGLPKSNISLGQITEKNIAIKQKKAGYGMVGGMPAIYQLRFKFNGLKYRFLVGVLPTNELADCAWIWHGWRDANHIPKARYEIVGRTPTIYQFNHTRSKLLTRNSE
jgi:hypothetical protein